MEEAQAEEQRLPSVRIRPAHPLEEGRVRDRVLDEGAEQVGAQAERRLVGHLDAVLEDGDGEGGRRARREPEPVVLALAAGEHVLADLLERRHPADGEVAVLEHDPRAVGLRVHDELLRNGPLPLAERDGVGALAAKAARVAELEQLRHRVLARREDEDERHHARRVVEALLEVERGRLDELLLHVLGDEGGDHGHDAVGAQAAQDAASLKGDAIVVQVRVPLARQRLLVGHLGLVHDLPLLELLAKVGG